MSYFITAVLAFAAGIVTCKFWVQWRNAAEAKIAAKLGK
jgi:hypothetical protein